MFDDATMRRKKIRIATLSVCKSSSKERNSKKSSGSVACRADLRRGLMETDGQGNDSKKLSMLPRVMVATQKMRTVMERQTDSFESDIKQAGKQVGYSHRRRSRPWYPVEDGPWISSFELHRRLRRRDLLKATACHWQIACVWAPLHTFRR